MKAYSGGGGCATRSVEVLIAASVCRDYLYDCICRQLEKWPRRRLTSFLSGRYMGVCSRRELHISSTEPHRVVTALTSYLNTAFSSVCSSPAAA